jgi:hypothetical protein
MSDGPDEPDFASEPSVPAELAFPTLLVLVLGAAVLLWAYLGSRPISPSLQATENPAFSSGG